MALSSSASTPTKRSLEHWTVLGATVLAALAIVALGLWTTPDPRGFGTHEQLGMPPCQFLVWTGIPCPGCGVTTSVALAAQGEFVASFRNQPFGLFAAIVTPIAAIYALVLHARGRDLGDELRARKLAWIALAIGLIALGGWIWKFVAMRGGAS